MIPQCRPWSELWGRWRWVTGRWWWNFLGTKDVLFFVFVGAALWRWEEASVCAWWWHSVSSLLCSLILPGYLMRFLGKLKTVAFFFGRSFLCPGGKCRDSISPSSEGRARAGTRDFGSKAASEAFQFALTQSAQHFKASHFGISYFEPQQWIFWGHHPWLGLDFRFG